VERFRSVTSGMGQGPSGLGGIGGSKQGSLKKGEGKDEEKKKWEPPAPTRVGKKRVKKKGPQTAAKVPAVLPVAKCKLRLSRLERIKDLLLLEEEFIRNQEAVRPSEDRSAEQKNQIEELRGAPLNIGTLEEVIDDNHAIVSSGMGLEHYVCILSIVDKDQIEVGCSVLLHNRVRDGKEFCFDWA